MDDTLLTQIRHMVETFDPVPDHLPSSVLVLVETDRLFRAPSTRLLRADHPVLAGTRSDTSRALRFTDDDHEVLLRVTEDPEGLIRIDGWMTPAGTGHVTVRTDAPRSEKANEGRFHLSGLRPGGVEVAFAPADGSAGWRTPLFRI